MRSIFLRILVALMLSVVSVEAVCAGTKGESIIAKSIARTKERKMLADEEGRFIESQILHIDSVLSVTDSKKNPEKLISLYVKKSELEYLKSRYNDASQIYDSIIMSILRMGLDNKYVGDLPLLYLQQAELSYIIGKYDAGMGYVYDVLKLEEDPGSEIKTRCHTIHAKLYMRLNKEDYALSNLETAKRYLAMLRQQDLKAELGYEIDIAFSSAYIQKEDYKKALEYIGNAQKNR